MAKSRGYCFTVNNYNEEDFLDVITLHDLYDCKYLGFGFECGASGTHHIQGFVYYPNRISISTLKMHVPRAHFESMRGSLAQNEAYCSKENYYSAGEMPRQGKAAWDRIEDAMKDPRSNPHIFHQYRKTYREILSLDGPADKSRQVCYVPYDQIDNLFSNLNIFGFSFCIGEDMWDGEDVVLIEYDGSPIFRDPISNVMMWQRGYPCKVKYGYEFRRFDPDLIIYIVAKRQMESFNKKSYVYYIDSDAIQTRKKAYESDTSRWD